VRWGEDREHQRHVLSGDEVERAAHRPGPDDAVLAAVAAAHADRERRGGAVLGLDADELPDDVGGGGGLRAREPLGVEAVAADLVRRQAARSSSPSRGRRRETTLETPLPAIETP
jgi:hypothetical protein